MNLRPIGDAGPERITAALRSFYDGDVDRRDGRHVVVLGDPVAPVAQLVGDPGEPPGGGDRVAGGLVAADGHEVEHGEGSHCRPSVQRGGDIPVSVDLTCT